MRERALLLVLTGACLLSLLVAYQQHEAVQETLRDAERLAEQDESKTARLRSAVKKNLELSERITRLTEESVRHRTAATEARKGKEALESTVARLETSLEAALQKDGHGRTALGKRIAGLESAVVELTARLQDEHEATQGRLKEVTDLVSAGESRVLESLQSLEERLTTLAALSGQVDEISSLLRGSAPSETRDARVLAELARLSAQLEERQVSLRSLNRKIEILGEMLAVDGRPIAPAGSPPPTIEATVGAVDRERNEIALRGDVGELRPGHVVWISRDGIAVGRAEVFRVDAATRLAAARIVWAVSGRTIAEGDRVTTDRPAAGPRPDGADGGAPRSEKDAADHEDGGENGGQEEARQIPEGPISLEGPEPGKSLNRSRPPPPPPRPDGED